MTLVDRSPWVEADGTIALDITTEGSEAAVLQVVIREPVDSVEELERSLDENVGRVIHRSPAVAVGLVEAQADGSRRVSVPTVTTGGDEFTPRLARPGVYPLVLTLSDETGVVDEIRTPVVRLGTEERPLPAPRLELLVDLSVPPTITPDGRRELDEEELDRLDRLRAALDETALGGELDLTVSVSPDTLDVLTASPDPRAAAVLDAVTGIGAGSTVLGLPTVPLSASAVADAGLDGFLVDLLDSGRNALRDRIDADLDTELWDPVDGIDRSGAALLARAGLTHVLLGAAGTDTDSPATERRLLDAGPVRLDATEPLEVLRSDTETEHALSARSSARVDAGHIALADLIVRDDGERSRVVLRIDDVADDALLLPTLQLLATPGSPVQVRPVSTGPLPDGDDEDDGTTSDPDDEDATDEVDLPEVSTDLSPIATQVRRTSDSVGSFADLVGTESARADELRLQIATSLASGVEDDVRRQLLDSVERQVHDAFDAVTLGGQTDLNLTSRSGTLPLRIHNENEFPVRVVLRISSDRLRFPDGGVRVIDATEEITRVDIPVEAQATGSVPTFVQITSPDGRVVLDERRLNVRSTAVSGVGLALSLGALAVLVIWWARTWRRSRRDGEPIPRNPDEADRVG